MSQVDDALRRLAGALVPARCPACRGGCAFGRVLCAACEERLAATRPPSGGAPAGVERCWSLVPYEGIGRDLLLALKFGSLLPVAELMAERIAWAAPPEVLSGTLVPVPPAPHRALLRGFDPAALLAAHLSRLVGSPSRACLARRGVRRQLGRRRSQRLFDPPAVTVAGEVPAAAVLVDDVVTTGATLASSAAALRRSGAERVDAVTFARRL